MRIFPIIKCIPYIPYLYFKGKQKCSMEEHYKICHKYANILLKQMGYTLKIEGYDRIKDLKGVYFVCNHQGTIDPLIIAAACENPLSFISKIENESIPLLGMWAVNIGTIHFDRETREGNVHMLRETIRALKKKRNLLIFPEGTRSKGDEMNEFKDKAFQPAIMAKYIIVPVTLNGAYCLDRKDINFKELKITFEQPIYYDQYSKMNREELSDYVYQKIKSHLIFS